MADTTARTFRCCHINLQFVIKELSRTDWQNRDWVNGVAYINHSFTFGSWLIWMPSSNTAVSSLFGNTNLDWSDWCGNSGHSLEVGGWVTTHHKVRHRHTFTMYDRTTFGWCHYGWFNAKIKTKNHSKVWTSCQASSKCTVMGQQMWASKILVQLNCLLCLSDHTRLKL